MGALLALKPLGYLTRVNSSWFCGVENLLVESRGFAWGTQLIHLLRGMFASRPTKRNNPLNVCSREANFQDERAWQRHWDEPKGSA